MKTKPSVKLLSGAAIALLMSSPAVWAQQRIQEPETQQQELQAEEQPELQQQEAEPQREPPQELEAQQLPEAQEPAQAEQPELQRQQQAEQPPAETEAGAQAEAGGEVETEVQAEAEIEAATEINVTSQQVVEIRQAIIAQDVDRFDVAVSVGTTVPHHVALHVVPQHVIEIVPQFRGHLHFVLADERIVIIDPCDLTVVAIIA